MQKLLQNGLIREVRYSKCLSNVVVIKKKTGNNMMGSNFTVLNKACPNDPFCLPHIDTLVDVTAGHKMMSFMDAFLGYNQIHMHLEDQEKTTFITARGIYCHITMPFGLKNAGLTYQRLVNKIFVSLIRRTIEVYIDDMIIKSKQSKDHTSHL